VIETFRRYWVYLLVLLLPFERIPTFDLPIFGSSVTIRLSQIVAALAIVLVGWRAFPKVPWLSLRKPYFWLLAYLAVATVSIAGAISFKRGLIALAVTTLVVATSVLISRYSKQIDWDLLLKVLTWTSVFVSLIGIYQFFGDSLGLSTSFTGLKENYVKSVFGFPRIQSTGLEPLYFANFLLFPLLITMALVYMGKLRRWWWLLILALYAYTLTLTLSRGALWGSVAGIAVVLVLLFKRERWRRIPLVLGMVAVGALATLGSIYSVTQSSHSGSKSITKYAEQTTTVTSPVGSPDNDRETNRKLALKAFQEKPILGFGLANFGSYAKEARPDLYGKTGGEVTVNNEYFEVLAETGALGLITLLGFFVTLLVCAQQSWKHLSADKRGWMIGLTAILAAYAVQYYAFSTLYIMHIWVVIGLLLGLAMTGRERKSLES
jgi:O-antigen ligase